MRIRQVLVGALVCVVGGLSSAWAQQAPPPSCEQQLVEQRYKTNLADMTQRYIRDTMSMELRQAVERLEAVQAELAALKAKSAVPQKQSKEE